MTTAKFSGVRYKIEITAGNHTFYADEPEEKGGADSAPNPMALLEASLASCTAITLGMYVERKGWTFGEISISVDAVREDGKTTFKKEITIEGEITDAQKQRLLQIADACPVSKVLEGKIEIESSIV